jgi:hypothetical protein
MNVSKVFPQFTVAVGQIIRYGLFVIYKLERGPLSLVSTTEERLERKSNGSTLKNREYGRRDPSRLPRGTLIRKRWQSLRRQAAVARSV